MLFNIPQYGFAVAIAIAFIVIGSISIHEFSHAFVAHLRGDDTAKYNGRMTLNPVAHFEPLGFILILFTNFGWGKPVPVNPSNLESPKTDNILVAAAGPASNLLVAIIAALLLHLLPYLQLITYSSYIYTAITLIIEINVGLAVFNLLPIPPLDGSNLYRPLLPLSWQYALGAFPMQYILFIFILAFFPLINGQSLISFIMTPIINFIVNLLV